MSDVLCETSLVADKDKTNLGEHDLFDRIINLKLVSGSYVRSEGNQYSVARDEYVIRSDYELYFPSLMRSVCDNNTASFLSREKCIIRKCQYKPSIKVQYKRVSLSSGVEVDIYIHNFHMLDKDGRTLMHFNNATYPLLRVELAMGYFGQFEQLFSNNKKPENIKQMFNLGFTPEVASKFGITVLTISNVSYTQLDKLPPDSVLHIHGYVGNLYSPQITFSDVTAKTDYETYIKSPDFVHMNQAVKDNWLEEVYYKNITKEFIRTSALDKATMNSLVSSKVKGGSKETLSDKDASEYGIRIYLSKGATRYAEERAETFPEGEATFSIPKAGSAEEKMNGIANVCGLTEAGIKHTLIDSSGDYFVYTEDETEDCKEMLKDTEISKLYEKTSLAVYWKNKIPAVYNITVDALCTIVCPFFCFLNPFETVEFKTRYSLGGIVKYFTDINQSAEKFYVLWENVSFATVEDVNECTIVCIGERK